ncbi:MAG: hypothetical protein KME47_09680 [Nodosilinea sp. WJT8-NPBG4]|jgi:hypothetical protein|nr:hypothetical protein [Nodosilinea sp. WJT8-NPBG4]
MAVPSITGATLLRSTTSNTGIVSSDATISISTGTTSVAVSSLNPTANVEMWVEFTADGTFDLTGRGIFFGFRHTFSLTAASFAFLSTNGERRWNILCGPNNITEFYLEAQGSNFADTGTFDITAVNKIRFYVTSSTTTTSREVSLYRPYSYLKSTGINFGAGEVGNPLTPGSTYTLIQSLLNGSSDGAELISGNYVGMPVPLTLAPTVSSFLNGCLAFQPNAYSISSGTSTPRISLTNRVFRIDSTASQTFSGVQFVGTASEEFTFADVSIFINTYSSDVLILRHSTVSLGLAVFNGVLASGTGSITGGTSFGGAVRSNTASYAIEWNGTTTFNGLNLTGTSNAHFINCSGSNFTSGATLDVTGIIFGTPGTRKVRVDASGKTLNIQTSGNFTLSDVTVVAGTVNIIAPTPTLTLSGIPAGGIFTIWDDEESDAQDLGTALQVTNPTTGSNISYVGTAGNSVIFQFVPNTGDSALYREFNIAGSIPATSQTLDLASNLELEVFI